MLPAAVPRNAFRSRAFVALALLAAAKAAFLAANLRYDDLVLDYPFAGGDGYEWVSNGLAWTGAPVRFTARPPLLPWILAMLDRLGALAWFPPLNQLVLPAGAMALYLTVVRWQPPRVALLASLLPLVSAAATGHGLELMADTLAAVLLFAAIALVLAAEERPWLYAAAGALGAASTLTQHAGLLLPVPVVATLLVCRRQDLRRPQLGLGAVLFTLPCAAWFAGKALALGFGGDSDAHRFTALGLRGDALGYYGAAIFGLLGIPATVLAAAGALRLARRRPRDARTWLVLGSAATLLVFLIFLYGFRFQRLMLYLLLPGSVLLAEGLAALRRPALQVAAGLAALLWAAWPVPGAPSIDSGFVLLPVPGLHAYVSPHAPPLLHAGPAAAWRSGPWSRVLRARSRRPPGPRLDAATLGAGAVVFVHRRGDPDHGETVYRLGDALRRRVQWMPAELYPASWWGWRDRRFLGEADAYAFFGVPLPLPQRATLVAFDRDDPAWRALRDAPPPLDGGRPSPQRLAAISGLGRRLDGWAGAGDPFVAVIGAAGDEQLRLLPFVMRTSSLFVLTGDEGREALRELERHPGKPIGRSGDVRVVAARLFSWRALVALTPGGPGAATRSPALAPSGSQDHSP